MNYSDKPYMVRGDLFTGHKWKYTVTLNMQGLYETLTPTDAVNLAWERGASGVADGTTGYFLVVLNPYHCNTYPVITEV